MWSNPSIIKGIKSLISHSSIKNESLLKVRLTNYSANRGVFNNSKNSSIIQKNKVLTLYPGYYVPPLPDGSGAGYDHEDSFVLIKKPSEEDTTEYVINSLYGGYIDAINEANYNYTCEDHNNNNYIALGHLINHASNKLPNVEAFHFSWKDILLELRNEEKEKLPVQEQEQEDNNDKHQENNFLKTIYNINFLPQGEWYFDTRSNTTIQFPDRKSHPGEYLYRLKGIAVVSTRDIAFGEELLLDYDLRINQSGNNNNNHLDWYQPALKS